MKYVLVSVIAALLSQTAMADYTPNGAVRGPVPPCSQAEAVSIAQHLIMNDMAVLGASGVRMMQQREDANGYYFLANFTGAKTESVIPEQMKQGAYVTVSKKDCGNQGHNYGDFNAKYEDESYFLPANTTELK